MNETLFTLHPFTAKIMPRLGQNQKGLDFDKITTQKVTCLENVNASYYHY
tara:strand:- start:232 stop:381 length:150 start_codon:yes stop_codon:yes gene_type:complete